MTIDSFPAFSLASEQPTVISDLRCLVCPWVLEVKQMACDPNGIVNYSMFKTIEIYRSTVDHLIGRIYGSSTHLPVRFPHL